MLGYVLQVEDIEFILIDGTLLGVNWRYSCLPLGEHRRLRIWRCNCKDWRRSANLTTKAKPSKLDC